MGKISRSAMFKQLLETAIMSCAINTKGLWPLRVKGPGTFLFYPKISDPKQIFLTVTGNTHLQGR